MMATRDIVVTTLVIVAIVAVLFATYASCRNNHLKCGAPPPATTNWLLLPNKKPPEFISFRAGGGTLHGFAIYRNNWY